MKKTTSAFFAACVLLAVSCGQTQQKSTQNDNVTYETLEVTLSDRILTTSYPAAINGVQTVEIRPQVELSEVSDRYDEIQAVINLYQALGGGY